MNVTKTSAELKANAKSQLLGKYGTVIGALLIIEGIAFFLSILISSIIDINTITGTIIYYIISFILQLILSIFIAGQCHLYLNIACKKNYNVGDIFYGFKACANKAILVQLVLFGLCFISMIPAVVCLIIYKLTASFIALLFFSLFCVIGGIIAYFISLMYSQAFYIMLDFPQYSTFEILHTSKLLMNGHKGRLFYLQVSFIPLYLLSLLSCGIGLLWIVPYSTATHTNFYLNLVTFKATV